MRQYQHRIIRFTLIIVLSSLFPTLFIGSNQVYAAEPLLTAPSSRVVSGASGLVCPPPTSVSCPITVSGLDSNINYLISIRIDTSGATAPLLKISDTSTINLSFGYSVDSLTAFSDISFSGTKTAINNALATLTYVSNGYTGETNIKITATEDIPGVAYFAQDDHFYKVGHFMTNIGDTPTANQKNYWICAGVGQAQSYIDSYTAIESLTSRVLATSNLSNCPWSEANRLAKYSSLKGQNGYLANITTADENNFLMSKLQGALNVWIGGTDGTSEGITSGTKISTPSFNYITDTSVSTSFTGGTEGLWRYYDGPEKGLAFWRYLGPNKTWNSHSDWNSWRTDSQENAGYDPGPANSNSNTDARTLTFSNWCYLTAVCYEPNNSSSLFGGPSQRGEDNIVFNWERPDGYWNDLNGDEPTVPFYGYIIEYGGMGSWSGVASKTIRVNPTSPVNYTISASSDVNGSISATGNSIVATGGNKTYTFSPSTEYRISNVLVDGISQGTISSYTFSNIGADHTISVVFEKIPPVAPTYVPQKSPEQIAAEAAAQKIADEKAAEVLAVQQKALSDNAEADKAFKTLQDQLATLLSAGVFPKLPTTTKAPTTSKTTTKAPTSTATETSKSGVTVPDGTVLITPNQIATLDIAKSGSGASANIAISQLKSGQRVRVTVISKADLNTKVVDLNSTEITTITPGPIKPSPAVNPTLIDIKPAPKTNAAAPNKAEISVSGVKKNQRVRVTVKSK